ncbi:cytokine receptor-like isoform X2 [Chrysoperla carnea]|uniref:cytokine receptor-like isoform X2 n=1 Tax=Chrysoperla carnea TaxID=189513 RepID=UPI001D082B13|nr:cytokine receptor-like isoform X2 [Chrysoperla carnea]
MKWSRSQIMGCPSPIRTHLFLILIYFILCLTSVFGATQQTTQRSPDERCASFNTPGMTKPKGDIVLEEGQDLDIYCILNDEYMKSENHMNSSHLVFDHDSISLRKEMVEIVNASTIRLHVKNVTRSYSNYYCKFDNGTKVCYNKVAVDTKPRDIEKTDFQCYSNNWQNLTCKWRVPEHYVKTNYTLTYMLPGRAARVVYACPPNQLKNDGNEYQCFWSLNTRPLYRQTYPLLKFTLNSSNIFGETINIFEFSHYAYVIPSRPEGLTDIKENRTAYSALLEWNTNIELLTFPPGILYQLKLQSQFDDKSDWEIIEFGKEELKNVTKDYVHKYIYPLNNLKFPNTIFEVQLRSRSKEARNDCCWSGYANYTFKTLMDRPSQPPRMDVGSFEIIESVKKDLRDVYIYWQQIRPHQQNGDNFNYTIIARENNKMIVVKPVELKLAYAKFNALGPQEYLFEVLSTNAVGHSDSGTIVRIPSLKNMIPQPSSFTKIIYENNKYELSWIAPKTHHKIKTYTIFWCKKTTDRPFQCNGYLNWNRVNGNLNTWNLTMEDDGIYQFAISANTDSSSSGMAWAKCTVIHDKLQGKMRNFYTEAKGPNVIDVNWKLECSGRIGVVIGFQIYYCPVLKQESSECLEPEKNLTVRGDLSTNFENLTNLIPFTWYRINIAVITRNRQGHNDEGPKSDPQFVRTDEAPPGKPRNAMISDVTNTTISIVWDAPETINGVLRHFKIKYKSVLNVSDNGEIQVQYQGSQPNNSAQQSFNVTLTGLRSYTRYNIELSACTRFCSEVVYLNKTTSYGVPDKMHKLTTSYNTNGSLSLEWIPPANPGGPAFYQLRRDYFKDQLAHQKIYNSTDNPLLVKDRQICDSDSRITFIWRVRAVVIVDNNTGERLEGPWSDSIEAPCTPQSSSLLMYCILVMFLLIAICLFTFYGNKVWIHCKDMRNVEVKLPPGLTTASGGVVGDSTHWSPQGSLCITQKLPKDRPITDTAHHLTHHIIAADEQLLLEKKREFDSELTDLSVNQSMTMNLSNSETASVCNSSNESEISSSTPITNLNLSIDNNSSSSEKDNCSLRLRNVQTKPTGIVDTQNQAPWTKGYVTLPTPDKNDQFATGPWSKAMQLKTLDGYSQIGVDGKQMQAPPANSGYVPHTAMSPPAGNVPPQVMPIIKASPQSPENITSTGAYLLPKPSDDLVKTLHDEENDEDDDDDDDYNLSEQDSPLVDLEPSSGEFSSIETDDLINIEESGVMIYDDGDDVTCNPPGQPPDVTESTTPYVSLATAMSRSASQRDQSKLPAIVDNTQAGGPGPIVSPTQPSSTTNKPTTPNPYSRIGIWDNTPSSVTTWQPPPTGASAEVNVENKEFVLPQPAGTLDSALPADKTQPASSTTVGGDHRTATKSSGYVPHRQFDCKLFKED